MPNFPREIQGNSIDLIIDKDEKLFLNEIKESDWLEYDGSTLNFGFYTGQIWIRLNPNNWQGAELLELRNPNLDEIEVFEEHDGIYKSICLTGDLLPFSDRPTAHRFFQFNIDDDKSYILRIKNTGDQFFIPIYLDAKSSRSTLDYDEQFIFGLYFGLCLFVFILNLFLYLKIREQTNLFYLFYVAGLVLLQLALSGLGAQYIFGEVPYMVNHAPPFAASASVLALIYFTRHFLHTKEFQPKVDKLLGIIAIVLAINTVISLIPVSVFYRTSIVTVNVVTLVLNILILPISINAYRKHFKPARFFLIAFSGLIICVFIFILRNFGVLSSNIITDNSLLIGSSFELVLLSFAIVDKFRQFKEDAVERMSELNRVKDEQNIVLEKEVKLRTQELAVQKLKLEEKNQEVVDSINYAKRIQSALIPDEKRFKSFFKDAFVLFKPRDIVSGDFYWVNRVTTTRDTPEEDQLVVFSVGDCTGHGVPGAILSVLGLQILNSSVKNSNINTTQEALDYLNDEFNLTFSLNEGSEQINDGMDVVLCALDKSKRLLHFSGAKNSVIIVRSAEIIEVKGDRKPIGSSYFDSTFTGTTVQLEKGDIIYAYTDGYPDQFGGPNNKKFKYGNLKSLLLEIAHLPMHEQHQKLFETFEAWKGQNEQTDDVSIIGVLID